MKWSKKKIVYIPENKKTKLNKLVGRKRVILSYDFKLSYLYWLLFFYYEGGKNGDHRFIMCLYFH
uniref:Uncharacterized protein n=1 Tax=Parascaris univalens TaxID=6257 RepID=A0A915BNK5_PARUN